ncbi:VOC family protein [Metapseudomonas furukawaii]|jgi:catechol 2,3-dioxygenase-like lactoylglutathione lyase family enzyme|uniref:Lactoylglutathione lyase and related lyases n=1 Tax=Metapseudomonas furukawaii TaxID=1149133 RepID=A0AAD1FE10_METFU|nr:MULTISPECIES: VOC family protein [Pseudomonas]ELS24698.1 lactoylglutathione lyase [Pseudomonas furukawaii]OWJ91352.1 glyoxalase [Pseudomonas sp. A46]WAG79851.1 VOC family protein [Pseudomonas furukawaii]BAU72462.1 lactoylglutathione lyase and related lyases [Pseudomonas furukawaii]
MADNPSILSHISLGTNDFERAVAFYEHVLPTLGCKRIMAHPGAVAFGREYPEFWIQAPIDGRPATTGNGTHVGFFAPSRDAVLAFYEAALDAGGTSDGEPGPRVEYGEPYYGCFIRDLDGHKIEATFWDLALDPGYEIFVDPGAH